MCTVPTWSRVVGRVGACEQISTTSKRPELRIILTKVSIICTLSFVLPVSCIGHQPSRVEFHSAVWKLGIPSTVAGKLLHLLYHSKLEKWLLFLRISKYCWGNQLPVNSSCRNLEKTKRKSNWFTFSSLAHYGERVCHNHPTLVISTGAIFLNHSESHTSMSSCILPEDAVLS